MQTKRSRYWIVCLLLSMVLTLAAGCSNASKEPSASGKPTASSSSSASSQPGEKLPIRYVMPGNAPEDQAAVEAAINQKLEQDGLNLTYKAIYIPWDVWDQKTNLMMSTGEEFELITIMHDLKGPNVLASNGGIMPIDELLVQYGADLKASIPDWVWDSAKISGQTYFVPNFWLDTAYSDGMFTMRTDLLESNNLKPPTTPEELLNAAEIIKKNWPEDNKNVYIRVLPTEPPAYLHTAYDTYPFAVYQDLIYIDQQGNVKAWIETEEFKKNTAFFRDAYKKGLVNPDILTAPAEVLSREESLGRILYREGEGIAGEQALAETVPGAKLDMFYFNDKPKFRAYGVRNSNGVSATSKHPEAAVQFLNWMMGKQDNFDLVSYGVKDTHWKDIGEGQYEVLKKDSNNAAAYSLQFWMLGNLEMNRWTPDTNPKYVDLRSKVADDAVNSITVGFNFDASVVGAEYANCLAELKASIYPIKLGLIDYEEAYPDALKKMKAAGLDTVVAEYDKQFKEWLSASK